MLKLAVLFSALCLAVTSLAIPAKPRVLIFSKSTGYRHASIEPAIAALTTLLSNSGLDVDATEDDSTFTDDGLANYRAVIFVSTTGNLLTDSEKLASQRYVESGGGFVGIHAAADAEYEWPWYGNLVGAWFKSHPEIQPAVTKDELRGATRTKIDEWYNFRTNPRSQVEVLMTVDESSYHGGEMGADHPVTWRHAVGIGRSWYTAMGHTEESYTDAEFLAQVKAGVLWSAGID